MRRALPVVLLALVGLVVAVLFNVSDEPPPRPAPPPAASDEAPVREHVEPRSERPATEHGALDVLVIDERGEPIAGAAVEVRDLSETVRRTTDGAGVARLRELPVGHVTVSASATGRAHPAPLAVALPAGTTVQETILLPRSCELRTRVVDAQGTPLAGVTVYADPNHGPAYRTAVTGPDGRCMIDGLPAGGLEVMTSPHSWGTYSWLRMPCDDELTLVLPVRGAIEGRVTDRESGLPIAGVDVGWRPGYSKGGNELQTYAKTDEDGRYRALFVEMPSNWKRVQARARGYVEDGGVPLRPPTHAGGPWRADLTLRRTGVVDLVVRTEDGGPADVTIIALGNRHYERFEPNASGHASLGWFAPGVVRFDVRGIGWAAVEPAAVVIPTEGRKLVELTATTRRPAVTVRGVVVDGEGAPLAGAVVSGDRLGAVVTDASGRFALRVPDTAWSHDDSVRLDVRRGAGPRSSRRVRRDDTQSSITLEHQEVAVVHGRLVDEAGHGLSTAVLRHVDTRIPVSGDGRFHFTTHARKVWLRADAAHRAAFMATVDTTAGAVVDLGDVVLAPLPPLDGRVIDDAGTPVAGALVAAAGVVSRTGEDGAFHVSSDGGEIEVVAPGHVAARIDSPPGGELTVTLQRHRVLSGTVAFENGTPVRGALVQAVSWEDGPTAVTDDAGRFAIRGAALPDPVWVQVLPLSAEHPQGIPTAFEDVGLAAGDVSLVVSRGAVILGCVLDAEGGPLPAMAVVAWADSTGSEYVAHTATDADGRFAFQGVPPDEVVRVQVMNGNEVLVERTVPAGGDDDLRFRLLPAASITGVVRAPDGEVVGDLEIVATPIALPSVAEARNESKAMVGPDGCFELTCVEGQHYLLRLERNSRFAQALDGGADVAASTRDVEFGARRGVSYSGTFVRHDGAPPQTYVSLRPKDPQPGWEDVRISVQTDEEGTFRIDGLDPGVTYRVSARDYPYGGWIRYPDVRLTERGLHDVTLDLK